MSQVTEASAERSLHHNSTAGIDQCSAQKHAQNIEITEIKLPNKVIISMFLAFFTTVPGQNIRDCLQCSQFGVNLG
jgi:hypothetical protein